MYPSSRYSIQELIIFLLGICFLQQTSFAQRDLKDIPEPNPVKERELMSVGEGSEVNLFASDPDFSKPIQINFDSTGGLWIASSEVYPQIEPDRPQTTKLLFFVYRRRWCSGST